MASKKKASAAPAKRPNDDDDPWVDTTLREAPPFPDRDFVERELTPERIESEGRRLLYRALNTEQVVGFIGSGVGSAFGRPTWSVMIDAAAEHVKADLELRGPLDERREQIQKVITRVQQAREARTSDPEALTLLAQLIRSQASELPRKPAGASAAQKEDTVQKFIKQVTGDDDEMARSAWKEFNWTGSAPDNEAHWWRWLDSWYGLAAVFRSLCRRATDDEVRRLLDEILQSIRSKLIEHAPPFAAFTRERLDSLCNDLNDELNDKLKDPSRPFQIEDSKKALATASELIRDLDDPGFGVPAKSMPKVVDAMISDLGFDAHALVKINRVWLKDRFEAFVLGVDELGFTRLSEEERTLAPLLISLALTGGDGLFKQVVQDLDEEFRRYAAPRSDKLASADFERSPAFDPMRQIFDDLEIKRLITTNYDFEIERGLERLGFKRNALRPPSARKDDEPTQPLSDAREAERPLGERARSTVFKASTASDLVGFAIDAERHDFEVFHLHGRAAGGADERLIITEPDYQAIYMRDTAEAHLMNEALTAVMAGNPIMFIGLGMQEADFLRPLRQFVAGPGPRINRGIVALMPAEQSWARCTRNALQLHLRYGVHTIYYGYAPTKPGEKRSDDQSELYRAIWRIRKLAIGLNPKKGSFRQYGDDDPCLRAIRAFNPDATDSRDDLLRTSFLAARSLAERVGLSEDDKVRSVLSRYFWGFEGRIRTRALCAALANLENRRSSWWEQWREPPKPRTFRHTVETWDRKRKGEKKTWEPVEEPRAREAYLGKDTRPIRNIRYRVSDFQDDARHHPEFEKVRKTIRKGKGSGRRVFVVHGDSGAGRGSLFHHLANDFVKGDQKGTGYRWGIFTNATFSTEYSSVIDGVSHFLERCLHPRDKVSPQRGVGLSRRDLVLELLREICKTKMAGRRGLFVIGGTELLFRSTNGSAKNSEIVDALSVFLDKDTEKFPIDVVLISRTDKCEKIFGKEFANNANAASLQFGAELIPFALEEKERNKAATAAPARKGEDYKGKKLLFTAQIIRIDAPDLETRARDAFACSPPSSGAGLTTEDKLPTEEADKTLVTINKFLARPSLSLALKPRFNCTIALSCAYYTHTIYHARKMDGEKAVQAFFEQLEDTLSKSDRSRIADNVITAVIEQYARIDRLMPGREKGERKRDPQLWQLILKHLSIMSGPVEIAVLAMSPEIIEECDRPAEFENFKKDFDSRVMRIQEHLQRLVERRLIFQIRERDEFRNDPKKIMFHRYAAHQSMQSYFFHQIGAPFFELGDSRLFTVSVLASQGKHLPAPTFAAFMFLMTLIRTLICYPEAAAALPPKREAWERLRDVCALRAAVSLTRSAFSFSVVSRFTDYGHVLFPENRHFGFLEEYRFLLRWMIWQSGILGDEQSQDFVAKVDELREKDDLKKGKVRAFLRSRLNALYQDEITWLYNECGLVSLVQGNLYDARSLFKAAAQSNRMIETGSSTGPNALRIRVNRAVVELERGKISLANTELHNVMDASRNEPMIHGIAEGYRGLIAHLKGRLVQAEEHYGDAIKTLRPLGEARAISIFRKHWGDLRRKHGDTQKCREELRGALAEADIARQQDQVYRVHCSVALCDLAEKDLTADLIRRVLKRLDDVIRYADVMEIHALKVEAMLIKAHVSHVQGETRAAGEEAVSAIALANLHGQRLRSIVGLAKLGEVISERTGYEIQGHRLLEAASKLADSVEYQLAKAHIEERLIGRSAADQRKH